MTLNLINKKYEKELIDYNYVKSNEIINIPLGCYILYISRNSLYKKGGFLKAIKDKSILELMNVNKKHKWYIYTDQYYIFYKLSNQNKLRDTLQNLLNTNFSEITKSII